MNYLIYDIEIKKAILGRNEIALDGIEYCAGWHDHENMGISCICAYESWTGRYRVFMDDNKVELVNAVNNADVIVGFNNIAFDNNVIKKCWPFVSDIDLKSYDLLVEIWKASGLGDKFEYPSHSGYGLDACCSVNFGINKTGNGAIAPIDYQKGEFGSLIDYCLNDVMMTKRLMELILNAGEIISPKDGKVISVKGF